MKQKHGSANCVAVCACTAFKCEIDEFTEFCNDSTGPYSIRQFIQFGFTKGYITGFYCFQKPRIIRGKILETFDIRSMAALVIVDSKYHKDRTHAIYWDGKMIHDPDPDTKNGEKLSSYKIQDWYPIFQIHN
jgi:hypothetical protein